MTIDLNTVLQTLAIAAIIGGVGLLRTALRGLGADVKEVVQALHNHVEEDAAVHATLTAKVATLEARRLDRESTVP